MSMRITNQMIHRSTLSDLQDVANKMSKTQQQLSSGQAITRPSDDPFATNRALSTRSDLDSIKQLQTNVDDALSWESVTDTALSRISDVVQRAKELLVKGANDTNGPTEREAIAKELDQLVETAKGEANASVGGRYVFSGTSTTTKPYAAGASDAYAGNTGTIARTIGPGVSVPVNVNATQFLGGDPSVAQPDGMLLSTLRKISTDLRAGTPAAADSLRGADMQALEANLDALSSVQATVGASTNRLETAQARLLELEET
jgi:flagellar hook-associated protein 3 FlgL